MTSNQQLPTKRICIFGAAPDTGNFGVSALLHSAIGGIARFAHGSEITVFDNGWGVREGSSRHQGERILHQAIGARLSRRYYRPESFFHMRLSCMLGGLGNPGAKAICEADAIWDISGGDSFGDLYGMQRWRSVMEPKRLALRNKKPLILLPQTYGPYRTPETREAAVDVLRKTRMAWARDKVSFETLKELLGTSFDRERHRPGVDMAFSLEPKEPVAELSDFLKERLQSRERPLVGLNVSGLIYNDVRAVQHYGLKVDYPILVRAILERFLRESEADVVLISHVMPRNNPLESDLVAAQKLWNTLDPKDQERVHVLPPNYDARETKWILSQLDWFAGTRMHACIAALSSGVPTVGLAYSLKFEGVFGTCAQREASLELRELDNAQVLDALWASWNDRDATRKALAERVLGIQQRALEQLQETLALE